MCSAKCCTLIVIIFGLVCAILSLVTITLQFFVFKDGELGDVRNEVNRVYDTTGEYHWWHYAIYYAVPAILFVIYLLALIGVIQKNRCLMCPFLTLSIIVYIIMIALVVLAVLLIVGGRLTYAWLDLAIWIGVGTIHTIIFICVMWTFCHLDGGSGGGGQQQ